MRRGKWREAETWSQQADEATQWRVQLAAAKKEVSESFTLRRQLEQRAREQVERVQALRALDAHGRAAQGLEAERVARVRALESQVAGLPKAPDEQRAVMMDAEIEKEVEAAVKRGHVRNGMRFGVDEPLEGRESYRDKLRIRRLEKILAARQKYLPLHQRQQEARRQWLEEQPADPVLAARAAALDKEAELAPLSEGERRTLSVVRQDASRDGDISHSEYERILAVLQGIEDARRQ